MTGAAPGSGQELSGRAVAAAAAPLAFLRDDPPLLCLRLLPHQPLGPRGAGVVIGLAALGLSWPLFFLLGHAAAWGMLPFLLLALAALAWALGRSHRDRKMSEEVCVWRDLIAVVRCDPQGRVRRGEA